MPMIQSDVDYRLRQSRCLCLKPNRRVFIQAAMDFASNFNDGAFFAYMAECGIDVSELEAFGLDHDCSKP